MIWVFVLVAWVAFTLGFLTACFLTAIGPRRCGDSHGHFYHEARSSQATSDPAQSEDGTIPAHGEEGHTEISSRDGWSLRLPDLRRQAGAGR